MKNRILIFTLVIFSIFTDADIKKNDENTIFRYIDRKIINEFNCQYKKEKVFYKNNFKEINYYLYPEKYFNIEKFKQFLILFTKNNNLNLLFNELPGNILDFELGKNKAIISRIIIKQPLKKKIAVIIDDLGFNLERLNQFISLNTPITFGVLPNEKYSYITAKKLSENNYRYLLHLPLEPLNYIESFNEHSMIKVNMSMEEIEDIFYKNLKSVKTVLPDGSFQPKGVNNHMGSLFTSDYSAMKKLFYLLKKENLYFIDSSTSKDSVSKIVAIDLNIPFSKNEIFLDTIRDEKEVEKRFEKLISIAEKKDYAIGIGHIYDINTFNVFKKRIEKQFERNYGFVFVEEVL